MSALPEPDLKRAHQFFSTHCFNQTWNILDDAERSAKAREEMLLLSFASLWHWTQRADCTEQTRSVGYWLVSRVYATLGQGAGASEFAAKCLEVSSSLLPFYRGYAHESMARALRLLGKDDEAVAHLAEAGRCAEQVADPQERSLLETDLSGI